MGRELVDENGEMGPEAFEVAMRRVVRAAGACRSAFARLLVSSSAYDTHFWIVYPVQS